MNFYKISKIAAFTATFILSIIIIVYCGKIIDLSITKEIEDKGEKGYFIFTIFLIFIFISNLIYSSISKKHVKSDLFKLLGILFACFCIPQIVFIIILFFSY